MDRIKKHGVWIIVIVFLLTRLVNLTLLPVFNDEAIYIDWGQKMLSLSKWFYSLYDGKQPALMWLFGLMANLFPNPLWGGRLVSVLFDGLSVFIIYRLANKKNVWLYVLSPLFLFFARQALMESAITAMGLLNYYLITKINKTPSLRNFLMLGFIWGIGLNIKLSFAIFMVASLPIMYKLFNPQRILMILGGSLLILIPLICDPSFGQIFVQNSRFSFTVSELIKIPVFNWGNNLMSILEISLIQVLGVILIPVIVWGARNYKDPKIIYILGSLIVYVLFTRNPNTRYIVPFLPLLFTIGVPLKLAVISAIYFLFWDALLIFWPINYFMKMGKITRFSQKAEYLGGFTSGYGVKDAINYIIEKAGERPTVVGVRVDAGNPENAVFMYLSNKDNFKVVYFDSRLNNIPVYPDYFVGRAGLTAGMEKDLVLEKTFSKPLGDAVEVYRVDKRKN